MLLQNKRLLYHTPGYFFGGSAIADSNSFVKNYRGRFIGETYDKKASMPLGTEGQFAYVLAQKGGGLASYTDISGSASISASQSNGINIDSTLEGTSTFDANANLITSMLTNLVGSGTLSASMVGTVGLASNLIGSGDVVGGLKMFAGMVASLNGNGTLEGTMKGWAIMSADIYVNQSDASVQQIVSGVWNAIATEYNTSGTMGEAVQTGGGGGGATPAQIWSYPTRTLTESAGLTTEEHDKLMGISGGGGGYVRNVGLDAIDKKYLRETHEKVLTLVNTNISGIENKINEIDSHIELAKEDIIDKIESNGTEVCSDIIRKTKELKEDNVKTRNLVRQKTKKIDENVSKLADRQAIIDETIEHEADEIESEIDRIINEEADMIEDEIYNMEADEIENAITNQSNDGNSESNS